MEPYHNGNPQYPRLNLYFSGPENHGHFDLLRSSVVDECQAQVLMESKFFKLDSKPYL